MNSVGDLSFLIQGNKLYLGDKFYDPLAIMKFGWGNIAVSFLKEPGWGEYFLFW